MNKNKIIMVLAGSLLMAALVMSGLALFLPKGTDQRLDLLLEQGFPINIHCNDGGPVAARIRLIHVVDQSHIGHEDNRMTYRIRMGEGSPKCLFNDGARIKVYVPDKDTRKGP